MEETAALRHDQHAQTEMRAAVYRMVRATSPEAFAVRPRFAGDPHPARWPDPGPALRETRRLARLAEIEARRLAREARGAGASWEQIARLAGLDDAAVAFDWAAGPPYAAYRHSVSWTCASCAGHVADYGPYSGEPEEGHTAGCARAARERAAQGEDPPPIAERSAMVTSSTSWVHWWIFELGETPGILPGLSCCLEPRDPLRPPKDTV